MNDNRDFGRAAEDDALFQSADEIAAELRTVAALALDSVLAHPLGIGRATLVIHEALRGEDEEFLLVRLALETGCDAVCLLDEDDIDGTGRTLVVQAGEDGAWIGYCRAFAASPAAQTVLVPLDPAHDLHLVMGADGRLERREGRPATHTAFGQRIAATRLGNAAAAIRDGGSDALAA